MPRHHTTARKSAQRAALLNALASGVTVGEATAAAGVPYRTAYHWRATDEDFAAAWGAAYATGTDTLAAEARRRAVDGVERPVFHNGKQVGSIREHSDTLLIFLMKARDPATYCDRTRTLRIENERLRSELAGARAELERVKSEAATTGPVNRDAAIAAVDALERLASEKATTAH